MKLITAIAALALLAGSMDVEAQKRGKADGPPGGGKKPGAHQKAPEGAETGKPHIAPIARLAIGAFGALDPEERKNLAEAAEEGDEEALGELRADRVEAIDAMLGALEDPASRKLVELGMTLAITFQANGGLGDDGEGFVAYPDETSIDNDRFTDTNEVQNAATKCLQHVQGQLEAQLESLVKLDGNTLNH